MSHAHVCSGCGRQFEARADAMFCSPACRQKAYRQRAVTVDGGTGLPHQSVTRPPTDRRKDRHVTRRRRLERYEAFTGQPGHIGQIQRADFIKKWSAILEMPELLEEVKARRVPAHRALMLLRAARRQYLDDEVRRLLAEDSP
jgi:hypothetical protein